MIKTNRNAGYVRLKIIQFHLSHHRVSHITRHAGLQKFRGYSMAAMKPVFPMIGLEYRYSAQLARSGHLQIYFTPPPRQTDSTANSSRHKRAGNHFKKPLINPGGLFFKYTENTVNGFR
jgi:hypothetical protein